MAQAETISTTRRTFSKWLIAASSTAIAAPVALAADEADPIFAAIDRHKRALADYEQHLKYQGNLEDEIPRANRKSRYNVWDGLTVVETDDPRWISAEQRCVDLSEREAVATMGLVQVSPTTLKGLSALIGYLVDCEKTGCGWPLYETDEGRPMRFDEILHRNISDLLSSLPI